MASPEKRRQRAKQKAKEGRIIRQFDKRLAALDREIAALDARDAQIKNEISSAMMAQLVNAPYTYDDWAEDYLAGIDESHPLYDHLNWGDEMPDPADIIALARQLNLPDFYEQAELLYQQDQARRQP
ncbi:hypothetical protein QCD60_20045 [Pokkaliibacter sp. MBI-7]|uniref:hypothetical protein n=1 Tax=Pokkaliibacter sp. MBI-7 TaxID=3040600 RepID=UPI00244B7215|nr:hypothetical protein [Pokkaliibacter sp. MBI-7]MDH2434838.1 hypothetical protein [Pokkaliibacter sp. MBI-7]